MFDDKLTISKKCLEKVCYGCAQRGYEFTIEEMKNEIDTHLLSLQEHVYENIGVFLSKDEILNRVLRV